MDLPTKKRLSATVYYLLTALVVSWPALTATGSLLADWRSGRTLTPLSLAVVHLLVLGFMLTVALGVLYQIVPIAFQAPPVGRHVLYWHLPLHLASAITLSVGFLAGQFSMVGLGGFGLVCSTAALFFFVLRSYVRARNKTPVYKGLAWPFASLWLVLFIGLGQAWFPARTGIREVVTHVLAGAFGFWSGLVLVLTYKLLPMFAISHGYKASLPRTLSLYLTGIAAWIAHVWLEPSGFRIFMGAVGAILVWAGLGSFAVDMVAIMKARKRRR
ncbi:MAG: hypothetical protein IRY98_12085, partial [Alicyclobacillaceae bacterium]|nr:hypothetical protein [Alicyclobacillaceae bacterium]